MNPLDQPSTSKGLGSEVHLDEDIQDILEYLYDSGSEIDDEVKDPDYENSASDELEFEEEEIPAKRPRLEVAPVRMLTTCRDTSTTAGTWRKDDPSPPTPPPFTARPGLNLVGDVSSPFDAFSLFFTENIFKSIKEETNRYARSIIDRESKKGPLKPHGMLAKWKAVSVAQIKLFFCVIIHMSLVKKPGMKDYWSTHGFLKNAFCQSINMPRTLFMRILSMLHLNDNSKYIEYGKPGHDRLFKIRPVLESLIYSFGNAYTPQQNLTIDEAMCPFRGRVGFRVYIKGKPHKYGIKIFQICEAVSGYAYNLDIYTGKDPEQPEHNSIPNLVDRLAKRFYGQGYHIYFDRWFSSPELFDKLWEKKTLAVGTVMPSRKTMPKTEFSQKLKRGEIIKMRRKHLLAIKWKDVRDVFMLSTVHEGKMMPVKPKTPTREELFKPDAVIDYNKGKVGVDRSDQMMAYYSFSRKTLKWWKKIFFHLFSLCFVNGNIIYNKANPDKKISLKDFYLAVGGELLNQASIEHSEKETTSKTDVARLLGKHYCYKIAPESGKAVQNNGSAKEKVARTKISLEKKLTIIKAIESGTSQAELRKKMKMSIKFCVKLQISATETFEMLNKAFPNDAPKRTTVFEWHSRFKAGRISIEDDPRQGRPKFQRTDENVQKITDLIKENPRTTLLELKQDTGISKTTIGRIVTEDLKLKKTPAKFIPRFLTNEQKLCRLATCEDMLEITIMIQNGKTR
ncbi:PGBD5 [Cordylochernes scorpioides]|uniref:PGBD5 n=1 Tax=Cordylochernes scorpioides TaxID=51811 RepID=A0ABY6L9A9_9ARAC|nr:PGBD5 [Cordylochernes scorpioides]